MSSKKWNFNPLKYRLLGNVACLAAIGIVAAGALAIYPPVILCGVALLVGADLAWKNYRSSNHVQEWFNAEVAKGRILRVEPQDAIGQLVSDISARYGQSEPPAVYINPERTFSFYTLGIARGWKRKRQLSDFSFKAAIHSNLILIGEGSLKAGHSEGVTSYILSHEIGHLKTEAHSLYGQTSIVLKSTVAILEWGLYGIAGLSLMGLAGPLSIGVAGFFSAMAVVAATKIVATASFAYASRIGEYKADRNALYITGDLKSGVELMRQFGEVVPKHGFFLGMFQTHPTPEQRETSLRRAWNKVMECERPPSLPPLRAQSGKLLQLSR